MTKKRIKLPRELEDAILYKSAKTCCVCRIPRAPVEIHHIDQNPANNVEKNLIAICRNCHDEAHTKRVLSKNLTPDRLLDFKRRWENEVAQRSALAMLPGSNLAQAMWTYINHQRLPGVMKAFGVEFDSSLLSFLVKRKVVDASGVPIFQRPNGGGGLSTIYDRFEWDDSQRIHGLYMRAVDELILKSNPIEIGAIWTKTEIRSILKPGVLCFCMRGFHFKSGERVNGEEDRLVYARSRNIEIQFMANTRHMYGSSALYGNFTGHRFAATLLHVKEVSNEGNFLVVRATPLAMGSGFITSEYKTPYSLRYGWARDF